MSSGRQRRLRLVAAATPWLPQKGSENRRRTSKTTYRSGPRRTCGAGSTRKPLLLLSRTVGLTTSTWPHRHPRPHPLRRLDPRHLPRPCHPHPRLPQTRPAVFLSSLPLLRLSLESLLPRCFSEPRLGGCQSSPVSCWPRSRARRNAKRLLPWRRPRAPQMPTLRVPRRLSVKNQCPLDMSTWRAPVGGAGTSSLPRRR